MRKFNITVNGKSYEVEVEELGGAVSAPAPVAAPAPAPVAAPTPKAAPTPVAAPAPAAAPAGATTVNAPMPGTILKVNVTVGQKVAEGDVLAVLEAMKMENEIMSPVSGTVASVNVNQGAAVNSGDVLLSIQ